MGLTPDPFKVVYNSDLIIRDQSEAATLCVFYDQVFLPYTEATISAYFIPEIGTEKREKKDDRRTIKDWEVTYGTLFDEGVLARLPPGDAGVMATVSPGTEHEEEYETVQTVEFYEKPVLLDGPVESVFPVNPAEYGAVFTPKNSELPSGSLTWGEAHEGDKVIRTTVLFGEVHLPFQRALISHTALLGNRPCRIKHTVVERRVKHRRQVRVIAEPLRSILSLPIHQQFESGGVRSVSDDLVTHMLRTDIEMPQIFTTLKGRPGRDVLVALEAEATFSYLLPKLRVYHPTQILELREKIADTREGFTMHLWKLSKGLEEHAKEDVPVKEIAKFAKNLIETELIPDFKEFRRQLEAKGAGRWDRVLDAAGKVAEIDAAPWTPKFWALFLKALGITIVTSLAEREDTLSNKYQALKFMSDLQSAASRLAG